MLNSKHYAIIPMVTRRFCSRGVNSRIELLKKRRKEKERKMSIQKTIEKPRVINMI